MVTLISVSHPWDDGKLPLCRYQGGGIGRRKIERAVMQNYKVSWRDELTDEVISHIVKADKEYNA